MGSSSPPDFDTWYEEQHPLVLAALTVASGRPDVAADATDEAFVRAYERWDRVRRMASPGGWLYRVALNDLRRRCRRQAVERELLRRQPPPAPVAATMPAPHVWEAVRRLPARQRTAVALRYILDLPEPEVARVMGVSRGSASASLTTARRRLETWLADDAPNPPPTPPPSPTTRTSPTAPARTRPTAGRNGTPPTARTPRVTAPGLLEERRRRRTAALGGDRGAPPAGAAPTARPAAVRRG
jgi:RNA polymerase sigma-70 factor (ECF subfamily)